MAVQPVCVSHSPASPQPQVPAFHVFSTHLPLPPPPRRLHPNAPLPPEVDLSPGSFHHGLPKQLSGRFMSTSFLSICYKSRIRSQKQNTVQCMRYSKPSRGGRSQPLLRYSLPHLPLTGSSILPLLWLVSWIKDEIFVVMLMNYVIFLSPCPHSDPSILRQQMEIDCFRHQAPMSRMVTTVKPYNPFRIGKKTLEY